MGGAKSGNIASRLAVDVFVEEVRRMLDAGHGAGRGCAGCSGERREAGQLQAVYDQSRLSSRNSTAWAPRWWRCWSVERKATVVNVGDSRAYHVRQQRHPPGHQGPLSGGDAWCERGELTPEEAKQLSRQEPHHPRRRDGDQRAAATSSTWSVEPGRLPAAVHRRTEQSAGRIRRSCLRSIHGVRPAATAASGC